MPQFAGMASALASWWFVLGGGGSPASPHAVVWTTAAVLLIGFALLVAVPAFTRSLGVRRHEAEGAALRRRALGVAVVPGRDPDARGRTRPRAPTRTRRGDVLAASASC